MPAAWSDSVDYALGAIVTHGGHTYEWSSADNDAAIEPPAGSWVRLDADPAQSGASVPYGHAADYGNWSGPYPAVLVAHIFLAEDYVPGDGSLTPAEGNQLPAMAEDGTLTFPDGGTILVYAYISGTLTDVVPEGEVTLQVAATGGNDATKVFIENAAISDGAETNVSFGATWLVSLLPGHSVGPLAVTVGGVDNTVTLTGFEFKVSRVA